MITESVRSKYTATIGIECHVQLKSKTKLFSAVGNDAREAPPNTLVSHIDFGLPGSLPVLNKEAVHLAARAGFALNSAPQPFSKFDRKHYFYPDLPMGYQITQYDEPIVLGGFVDIEVDGVKKTIGITRAHLEADAGKSVHPSGRDYSLVDLNRAGTPLLEIVSEPDMHSAAEAKAYTRELHLRMRYADVSDANLYYGNMRFDVNVSVSTTDEMGTRSETKNINSFRAVEKVVDYEINRQIEVLESGGTIIQETRGWDDDKLKTISQRSKENADDYRYMPDPDLPPVVLTQEYIDAVKAEMPVMPDVWRAKLQELDLSASQIDTLLEAEVEHDDINFLMFIEEAIASDPSAARQEANFMVNVEIPLMREKGPSTVPQSAKWALIYSPVIAMINEQKLSSTNAKVLLTQLLSTKELPADIAAFAAEQGLVQESNSDELGQIVAQVLADNPKAIEDVRSGELKAIGFLTGQVMKQSGGKANPAMAQQIIKSQLGV